MTRLFLKTAGITATCVLLILCACSKEYDDTDLRNEMKKQAERIAALETWQTQVNSNVQSLQSLVNALEVGDVIAGVTPFTTPAPGGYTITFTESDPITIYNGAKGDKGDTFDGTPQIGVAEFPAGSGVYYWTLDGEFIEADDSKMPVTGAATPQLRISEETNEWEVSYDNGNTWVSLGVTATGADGQDGKDGKDISSANAIFSGLDNTHDDYVIFILTDGGTLQVPRHKMLDIAIRVPVGSYAAGQSKTLAYTTTEPVASVKVVGITPSDWTVNVTVTNSTSGEFTITAPASFNTGNMFGEAIVLVSDGGDRTIMRMLEFSTTVSLSIGTPPAQTTYGISEPLNTGGLVVNASFGGGSPQPITLAPANFEYDFSTAGTKTVTINAYGATTSFNADVLTLAERIAAAPSDGTNTSITLYASEDVSNITITSGKKIMLGRNTNSMRIIGLSAAGRAFTVNAGGSLTLTAFIAISGSNITDNNAPLVYVNGGTFTMSPNSTLADNHNNAGNGGGLYIGSGSSCSIGGTITNNSARFGGGIYQANNNITLSNGARITGNSATRGGGGVYIAIGTLKVGNGSITNNETSWVGGGVYVSSPSGVLDATASSITGNRAAEGITVVGKDVYLDAYGSNDRGTLTVNDATQIGNLGLYDSGYGGYGRITLAAGTYGSSSNLVAELDLYAADASDTSDALTAWEGNQVVEGAVTAAIVGRIKLNKVYAGTTSPVSANIPVTGRLSYYGINSTSGIFERLTGIIIRP